MTRDMTEVVIDGLSLDPERTCFIGLEEGGTGEVTEHGIIIRTKGTHGFVDWRDYHPDEGQSAEVSKTEALRHTQRNKEIRIKFGILETNE